MKILLLTQYVELFHLLFLDQLGRRVDKQLYALKGGCNLRFFLKSARFSQDMDLDIQTIRKETLINNVTKILQSQPFERLLNYAGIEIQDVHLSKQTDTTQRWKFQLKCSELSLPVFTKIEFSRRGMEGEVVFAPVDPGIISEYKLSPILANHYTKTAAFEQKIHALAGRSQTQARDIFDIYHLLNCGVNPEKLSISKSLASKAESAALTLSYEDFASQVVSYLPPELQKQYSDSDLWDSMVLTVVEKIRCN